MTDRAFANLKAVAAVVVLANREFFPQDSVRTVPEVMGGRPHRHSLLNSWAYGFESKHL